MKEVRTQVNKGFTLIEIMMIVIMLVILGAVSVPSFQNYKVKEQVAEGIVLSAQAKEQVTAYFLKHGKLPNSAKDLNFKSPAHNFIQIHIGVNGIVAPSFTEKAVEEIRHEELWIVPNIEGRTLSWNCQASLPDKYLPEACVSKKNTD